MGLSGITIYSVRSSGMPAVWTYSLGSSVCAEVRSRLGAGTIWIVFTSARLIHAIFARFVAIRSYKLFAFCRHRIYKLFETPGTPKLAGDILRFSISELKFKNLTLVPPLQFYLNLPTSS